MRRGGVASIFVLFFAQAQEGVALAEDDAAETAAARALAVDGLKLADGGKCGEAVEKLGRAEKLHHAPIVLGRLGECQIAQGKIVDGTENLRKVLREALPPNPSTALVKARERAQAALDAAKPKIAVLTITVKGPPNNTGTTVTVDGQPISVALLDSERPSDPGEHLVEANAQGYLKVSSRVTLGPGEKQAVTLKLETDPNYVPPAAPTESTVSGARSGTSSETGSAAGGREFGTTGGSASLANAPDRSTAYISWAFGGAAVAVGAGFGLVAIKGKNDLESKCNQNACSPAYQVQLDSAKTAGTISTIAFGVGGAGLVLGTVLYFTAGPTPIERGAHARAEYRAGPRAFVGVGHVGFATDF